MIETTSITGTSGSSEWLLRVRGLTKIYGDPDEQTLQSTGPAFDSNICPRTHAIVALSNVSFDLYPGEVLGIVGESGSGKSTLVQILYFDQDATAGSVHFRAIDGGQTNLLALSSQRQRYARNHLLGMVYQNPRDGLNFGFTAGGNIAEKLIMAGMMHVGRMRERAGGLQQRVQISKAIANNPPLVFLDEVTSGLDVSVQAKVLDLIRQLQRELGVSMIVVSHDLGVIRMLTDRTIVLKHGHIVESGLTDQILQDPQHPYTQLLVSSLL